MAKLKNSYRPFADPRQFEKLLNQGPSLEQRKQLVENFDYDYRARKIFFEPTFRALLLLSMTQESSLNDLGEAQRQDLLFRRQGAGTEASTPALSKANARRPVEPFEQILADVMAQIEKLPKSGKVLRDLDGETLSAIENLLDRVLIFDATTWRLPPKVAQWARSGKKQAKFKVQLRLRGGYGALDKVVFTPGAGTDSPYFRTMLDLKQDAGDLYLFDAGYWKIKTYVDIAESGNDFVTDLHSKISYQVVEDRDVPDTIGASGYHILSDQLVTIGSGENHSEQIFRLLAVKDSEGKAHNVLTTLLNLEAEQICLLRRYRWTVEIVFRWLKRQLNLTRFIAHSPKGVVRQVLVTLILYGLMVLYHQQQGLANFSPVRFSRMLRRSLHQSLYDWGYEQGFRDAQRGLPPERPLPEGDDEFSVEGNPEAHSRGNRYQRIDFHLPEIKAVAG